MGSKWRRIKAVVLMVGIVLGFAAEYSVARAQETGKALLAGGCFWCVEADFEKVDGVQEAISGFAGGDVENPTYRQVVRGGTGHREVAEIRYEPDAIGYREIVHLFLRSIDPFDNGGQFCDRGFSYSPAIYALDDRQREIAEDEIAKAEAELGREIVVPVEGAAEFYPAEDYHQGYYESEERLAVSSVGVAVPKKVAYERYREGCRRDARVREVWGDDAPFIGG
jgi:peptide-methionine (S)-S-oxide reductase